MRSNRKAEKVGHPPKGGRKYKSLARLVVERVLGAELPAWVRVVHLDGDAQNHAPDNLALATPRTQRLWACGRMELPPVTAERGCDLLRSGGA